MTINKFKASSQERNKIRFIMNDTFIKSALQAFTTNSSTVLLCCGASGVGKTYTVTTLDVPTHEKIHIFLGTTSRQHLSGILKDCTASPFSVTLRPKMLIFDEFETVCKGTTESGSQFQEIAAFLKGITAPLKAIVLSRHVRSIRLESLSSAYPTLMVPPPSPEVVRHFLRDIKGVKGPLLEPLSQFQGDLRAAAEAHAMRAAASTKDRELDVDDVVARCVLAREGDATLRKQVLRCEVEPLFRAVFFEHYLHSQKTDLCVDEIAEVLSAIDVMENEHLYEHATSLLVHCIDNHFLLPQASDSPQKKRQRKAPPATRQGVPVALKGGKLWSVNGHALMNAKRLKTAVSMEFGCSMPAEDVPTVGFILAKARDPRALVSNPAHATVFAKHAFVKSDPKAQRELKKKYSAMGR